MAKTPPAKEQSLQQLIVTTKTGTQLQKEAAKKEIVRRQEIARS